MNFRQFLVGVAALWMFTGCDTPLYEFEKSFPNEQWTYQDSLQFQYAHPEKSVQQLKVGFQVSNAYPYRNLFLKFRIEDPAGKQMTVTPDFILMDSLGTWHIGGSEVHDFEFVMNPEATLEPGNYKISVAQYMRTDTLAGVRSFSFRVE